MRTKARLAASVALRIASGTSRALPWPKPTRPFWSPTTTSAAKPKRRPPFTTLATRLIWTSLSTNSLSRSSRSRVSRATEGPFLKFEAALAGCLGERFYTPMIKIAAAIEHDLLDAFFFGAFGNQLADYGRGGDVVAFRTAAFHA